MIGDERELILEEELLIVRHSGEIPEVALHSSLFYLCQDQEGPQLVLAHEEISALQNAAKARYREIILRDLSTQNRDLTLYRGMQRSICNWERFEKFCHRCGSDASEFIPEFGQALVRFLEQEVEDTQSGTRTSCINCTTEELLSYSAALKLSIEALPDGWSTLCREDESY